MDTDTYNISWPEELVSHITLQEASTEVQSSNPVDYAIENPIAATSWIMGAVVVGLVLRGMITRPKA